MKKSLQNRKAIQSDGFTFIPIKAKDLAPRGWKIGRFKRYLLANMEAHKNFDDAEKPLKDKPSGNSVSFPPAYDQPFASPDRLNQGGDLINKVSDGLTEALDSISFPKETYSIGKKFDVTTSGSLGSFEFDFGGDTGTKYCNDITGVKIHIHEFTNNVTGIDAVVNDAFKNLSVSDTVYGDNQEEIFRYPVSSNSGSKIALSTVLDFTVSYYIAGCNSKQKQWDQRFKTSFTLNPPDGVYDKLSGYIDSIVDYNSTNKTANLGDYSLGGLTFSPTLETAFDEFWDKAFGDASKWWDKNLSFFPNPFVEAEKAANKQLETADDYLQHQVEVVVNQQLNSGSVKPYLDTAFEGLYSYAWDQQTYPLPLPDGWT